MQHQIDDGVELCGDCGTFGVQTFCGECGTRHGPDVKWRECPACKAETPANFCPLCSCEIVTPFLLAMERGEVDWQAEANMAADMMQKIYAAIPRLRDDYVENTSLADALSRYSRGANG